MDADWLMSKKVASILDVLERRVQSRGGLAVLPRAASLQVLLLSHWPVRCLQVLAFWSPCQEFPIYQSWPVVSCLPTLAYTWGQTLVQETQRTYLASNGLSPTLL